MKNTISLFPVRKDEKSFLEVLRSYDALTMFFTPVFRAAKCSLCCLEELDLENTETRF